MQYHMDRQNAKMTEMSIKLKHRNIGGSIFKTGENDYISRL